MNHSKVYADPAVLFGRVLQRISISPEGCWLFNGCTNSRGYAVVGAGRKSKNITGHRLSVIARDGEIPEGMTVDHTCHDSEVCRRDKDCQHRRCVNPDHLSVVTGGHNTARRWESGLCAKGHKLATRKRGEGMSRYCPECSGAPRRKNSGNTSSDYWAARRSA